MNNLAQNAIITIRVAEDGTLAEQTTLTLTGGAGGNQVDPMGNPEAPDSLASQGIVEISGDVRTNWVPSLQHLSSLYHRSIAPGRQHLTFRGAWTDFPDHTL